VTVHFIGAGPGAPDLITVRGLNLIRRAAVVLYAGSLVPRAVVVKAKKQDLDERRAGRLAAEELRKRIVALEY